MTVTEILQLKNITKVYPGCRALDDVSISFEEGEVHALVGENGAGKSTFIKTISGAIKPTSGTIVYQGKEYTHLDPKQSIAMGIAVVYQEMVQFEAMTVADNIYMGVKEQNGFIVKDKERLKLAFELLKNFSADFSPSSTIRDLSMAQRQIVELTKAVAMNAKVIIMDEPTASITAQEQQKLYELVKALKKNGVTIIYISHRLEELFEICDRISVLRDGKYVTTVNITDVDRDGLIRYMVGRELGNTYPEKEPCSDEVVLDVKNVTGNGVENISFQLHRGEILGFGGLVGAGRTELMHIIYGAAKKTSGQILMNGKEIAFKSPAQGVKNGISLIPESRRSQGVFTEKPIMWNVPVSSLKTVCKGIVTIFKKEFDLAKYYKDRFKIKTPYLDLKTIGLSGGNMQKVVIAKALVPNPDIIIFDEPTRGIDVGARAEIYQLMTELAAQGKSIIMVSSDMEELLGMSERIIVLHEGKMTGELTREQYSQEAVLSLASGIER